MRVACLTGPGVARLVVGPQPARGLAGFGLNGFDVLAVEPASEAQLRKLLAERPCQVAVLALELAVASAGYATATLADSQSQWRKVNVQPLGHLLAQAGVRIAVLVADASAEALTAVAEAWVGKGVGAVIALPPADLPRFGTSPLDRLLSALAGGETAARALRGIQERKPQDRRTLLCGDRGLRVVAAASAAEPVVAQASLAVLATDPFALAIDASQVLLRTKRESNRFDVFLCHNSADKPSVKQIGARLKAQGILPWLDEWELPPGQPWQALLEQQITSIGSAAVFIGASGISPWHQQEMRGFLSEFADRQVPVIPVLLPDAPAQPDLPVFLRQMTWVDFRVTDPDPLERLMWGITGQRPEQGRSL